MAWPFASRPAAYTYIDNMHRSTTDQHAALLTRRDPAFEPDWAGFVAVDRGSAQSKAAHDGGAVVVPPQDGASVWEVDEFVARKDEGRSRCTLDAFVALSYPPPLRAPTEGKGEEAGLLAAAAEDFEPVIAGPWMLRWNIGACVA